MIPRPILRQVCWFAPSLLLLLPACSSDAPAQSESSELVALVLVDTLRRDALGCYGNSQAQTPNIDALAAQGTRFDRAISASGWTLPSVASILTGTWPALHKALGKVSRLTPITQDLPVAAEVFKQEGYSTLGFANAAFLSPLLGLDRGFEVFDHEHAYNWDIRRADATVDAALLAISERAGQKIFLLVHLFDAHLDYDPPDGFITPFVGDRRNPEPPVSLRESLDLRLEDGNAPPRQADIEYLRGMYQGEVAFIDRALGRMVDGLKELKRWDHTTLVITSDHGEEFWDHEGFEHGHTLYDELVRVPLIIRTPDAEQTRRHAIEQQVRSIDIMPTLFELAGIVGPNSFEGLSLVPDMRGEPHSVPPPAFTQSTLYGAEKMSWRSAGYCLIVDQAVAGADGVELYNLQADPLELHDISKEQPGVTQRLSRELMVFTRELEARASKISTPELRDMGPSTIKKYLESIEGLGYAGRDKD